ncbi:MAG: NAD(P)-dependent oxidoreductase [Clostridiales bacterium]|nr:NAD(P)-dependent oxidoreductase [Clostridiales bacterium]MCM1435433.1 NAD(P)-dependent oxidoreductase [Ruminococcus flavefaciens]
MYNSKILVTGATGLVGSAIVKKLLEQGNNKVVALVRNSEKAEKIFADYETDNLEIMISDICDLKPEAVGVDYIIHAASQTSSKAFVNQPVETINTAIKGTTAILEFARVNPVKSFVYLSSMEVYGLPVTDEKIYEDHSTNLDTMVVRSCYPESKRMCENICVSYFSEYDVPVKIVRLTQTFGPGVAYNDGRVFAEFARCAIEGRDIVLKTKGETKRNYLYLEDAVDAILAVLMKGENGSAYNAANEDTYCSIYEMAKLVTEKCSNKKISVIIEENEDIAKLGYAPTLKMNLSTEKLKRLGWKAKVGLSDMFKIMIQDMRINCNGSK